MIRSKQHQDVFADDGSFHQLFPEYVRKKAARHWTPLHVAKAAAAFLVPEKGARVLDIGSGAGLFCLAAAHYQPDGRYFGIEQRRDLAELATQIGEQLGMEQVQFTQGNFTQLDLKQYDHFYFFNAFYENLPGTEKIDQSLVFSSSLYHYYNRYLFRQLERMPSGTRIATYHNAEDELPPGYYVVKTVYDGLLKLWIKV